MELEAQGHETKFEMFNILGALISSEKLNQEKTIHKDLDLSGYSNGIYFLKVRSGNTIFNAKVIKIQ